MNKKAIEMEGIAFRKRLNARIDGYKARVDMSMRYRELMQLDGYYARYIHNQIDNMPSLVLYYRGLIVARITSNELDLNIL